MSESLVEAARAYVEAKRQLIAHEPGVDQRLSERNLQGARKCLREGLEHFVRARARSGQGTLVLVAVDDGEPARCAVDVAAKLAKELAARVILLHVMDPRQKLKSVHFLPPADPDENAGQEAEDLLAVARMRLPAPLHFDQIVRQGHASAEIVACAREKDVDLIIMGSHGRGRIARFVLGSVADAVVREAPCPVLVVGHEPTEHFLCEPSDLAISAQH